MIRKLTSQEVTRFLNAIGYSPTYGFRTVAQTSTDGTIIGAVGYDHWTPNSVQMHIWIPHPGMLSKSFIIEGFKYPFEMCGRGLVVGLTPSNNAAALHFNQRVGFQEVYRMRDAWDIGEDVVVQELRKENCRWLRRSRGHLFKDQKVAEEDDQDHRPNRSQNSKVYGRFVYGPPESVQ